MKNELKIFENKAFGKVRVIERNNEPWFVGKDVAEALGYSQPAKAIREHVKDTHKGVSEMDTPGGRQQIIIIDEAGLYSLVLRSKLPAAEAFQEWVVAEVIPSIRKTGSYSVNQDMKAKEVEARLNNSRARVASTFLKVAQMTDLLEYKHICQQKAAEVLSGVPLLPMQSINENTLSADEVGKELGISGNMVGRIANQHNLKTDEYGKYFYDKSRHCQKQVETFRYYRKVIPVIQSIIDNKKVGA
jgi:prophage antirepressor-like protein|nr:MAG TPA: repressor domain protein [Caudoviricetes sp.]